ncbi:MAG: hypothetical protein KY468_12020 [Armatimonadetes bacterium]|nr:hypothetical protein [Armatimonadota bacterium]
MGRNFLLLRVFFSVTLLALACPLLAIDITAGLNPVPPITANDLQSGAGSDLKPSYEGTGSLSLTGTTGDTDNWRVDVRRSDSANWPSGLTFSIKRTGDGTGTPLSMISGGTTYQSVGTTDTTLFSGSGDRSNISISFLLDGMSIKVPPSTFSTTLTFTVVDLL